MKKNKMRNRVNNNKKMESNYRSIFETISEGLIITDLETGLVVEANPAACIQHGSTREEVIGQKLSSIVHHTSQRALDEYILNIQSGGVFEARLLHTCQNGETFFAEWRGSAIDYLDRSCFLGYVRDGSKDTQTDPMPLRGGDIRKKELDTLLAISHILASTLELQPGLILDQLQAIVEYTRSGLFALDDSSLFPLALRGTRRLEESTQLQIHLQGQQETLDILLNGHQPIRIADLTSENTQSQFFRLLLEDEVADLMDGMRSWMWVPLVVENRLIGGLGLAHTKPDYFTNHHASLVLSVANQIAITMVNTELSEQAQELAVLEERQRLARNLHDAINQSLFTAGIIAEVIPRLWEQDQDLARTSLEDLNRLIRSAQAEMRTLLAELRPSTLTDTDLGELIKLLGYALSGRIDIPVVVNTCSDIILPPAVQIAFYRVCQEALNNIAKHAEAGSVEIDLEQDGAEISLSIRDNGKGFDQNQQTSGHYGLQMMQERSDAAGAQIRIISKPGQGTELTVRWEAPSLKEGK